MMLDHFVQCAGPTKCPDCAVATLARRMHRDRNEPIGVSDELFMAARYHAGLSELSKQFREWLPLNRPIWEEFTRLADKMRLRREHYSARAVIHVLRWERALRDATETELKINNNKSAEMARLYNAMVGREFFLTREAGGRVPGLK